MNINNRLEKLSPKSIVILRALQLGDMLCAVPALRALRGAFPDARITLISLPWAQALVERYDRYLNDFIEFPGFPGLPERVPQVHQFPAFLSDVQSRHYDLALQMHGSGSIVNPLVKLFGARQAAGFYEGEEYFPENGEFMPYPKTEPEVWRHLSLMEHLGIPLQGDELEFPLHERDWAEFHQVENQFDLKRGQYVVIHAGSRKADRRWPIDRFAALGDALSARGLQIVLTGTSEECTLTKAVALQMQTPVINLAGQTSLGSLAALLSASRLLICNATGVSHLADALNIPSVVLFTSFDFDRWAPKNQELHRILVNAPSIEPDTVLHEVDLLLRDEYIHAF